MWNAQNLDVVRRAYAAFAAGDIDAFGQLYASDVTHSIPGTAAIAGNHKGLPGVLAMYGKLAELSNGTMRVELEDVLSDGGDRVIAVHRTTAERDGRSLATREALLVTVVDGKVVEIQDFFSDIDAVDAFWQ